MRIRMGFWLKQSRTVLLFALAAGPAMCLYMWLINSSVNLRELVQTAPMQSAWFAGFLQMAMSLSVYRLYLPLAISFGSTRKEAQVGMTLMKMINTVGIVAIFCVYNLLFSGELRNTFFAFTPAVVGFVVFFGSIGSLFGMLVHRFGGKGGWLMGLICGVMGAVVAIFVVRGVFSSSWEINARLVNIIALILGGAFLCAELMTQRLILRNYAVKL
ncbi:MAG: hypothetical protein E7449_05040 [Ruminococcaceae bacterium]|nr:hypothetical protein [Oscillospiraceae bacterium]